MASTKAVGPYSAVAHHHHRCNGGRRLHCSRGTTVGNSSRHPAGEESDSDYERLPIFDPYDDVQPEHVSSGHEFESTIRDFGRGYDTSPVMPLSPGMPVLEAEVAQVPVSFVAEPPAQQAVRDVRHVAVGPDEPQPWYRLSVNWDLQSLVAMIQRNVGVCVAEILQTETGGPTQVPSDEFEVIETFVGFGSAVYQVAVVTSTSGCRTLNDSYRPHRHRLPQKIYVPPHGRLSTTSLRVYEIGTFRTHS